VRQCTYCGGWMYWSQSGRCYYHKCVDGDAHERIMKVVMGLDDSEWTEMSSSLNPFVAQRISAI